MDHTYNDNACIMRSTHVVCNLQTHYRHTLGVIGTHDDDDATVVVSKLFFKSAQVFKYSCHVCPCVLKDLGSTQATITQRRL